MIYVTTLAPGLLGGDAGELQFVPFIGGLAHVSGYPLQTLLDKLWINLVPIGTIAWRTNLLSALTAAAGAGWVYHTVKNAGFRVAGLIAALALTSTTVYWSQAVLADKYALNGLISAALMALAYRFYLRRNEQSLIALSLMIGLAMAHHRSLLVFLPTLAVLVLWCGKHWLRRPLVWLRAAGIAWLPQLFYLYLPWAAARGLPPDRSGGLNLQQLIYYVGFSGSVGQVNIAPQPDGLTLYFATFQNNFPLWLMIIATAGIILNGWFNPSHRLWLAFTAGSFLLTAYMAANYQNFDLPRRYVYFVPSYVCVALLIGEGLNGWFSLVNTIRSPKFTDSSQPIAVNLLGTVLIIPLLLALPAQWRTQWALQQTEQPLDIWRQTLKSGGQADRLADGLTLVQPNSMVVADWEAATPLWYAQLVNGSCPTCDILQEVEYMPTYAKQARQQHRPLYVARTLNQAAAWSDPTAAGPLVYLATSPSFDLPAQLTPLTITFDDSVLLAGYTFPLGQPKIRPGKVIPISLYWQRTGNILPDYAISWRLSGPTGIIWQADNPAPVLGMHPFSLFALQQVVADYYEIPFPLNSPPGAYELRLLLYRHTPDGGFVNAAASDAGGHPMPEEVVVLRW